MRKNDDVTKLRKRQKYVIKTVGRDAGTIRKQWPVHQKDNRIVANPARKSRARYTYPRATTHCHTELSYCTAPVSSVGSEAQSVRTATEAFETSDRGGEVFDAV